MDEANASKGRNTDRIKEKKERKISASGRMTNGDHYSLRTEKYKSELIYYVPGSPTLAQYTATALDSMFPMSQCFPIPFV